MAARPMDREPVRIPAYAGLALAVVLAGLQAYNATGEPLAAVIAALSVIVPAVPAVEYARARAWSRQSVEGVTDEAHADAHAGADLAPPELLLAQARGRTGDTR